MIITLSDQFTLGIKELGFIHSLTFLVSTALKQSIPKDSNLKQKPLNCILWILWASNLARTQLLWGEGNGTPLQCSCLANPMDRGAWSAVVHGVTRSRTRLSDFTFTFHFHALEKEMATHSSVLAWRIPRDRGAWWAAVYGVTQSRTLLKRLSSSSRQLNNNNNNNHQKCPFSFSTFLLSMSRVIWVYCWSWEHLF